MIKQPILFVIGILIVPVLGYFVYDRIMFVSRAVKTSGIVESLSAVSDTCGSKKSRYPCTKFYAELSFSSGGSERHQLTVSAGSVRGRGRSTSEANYRKGDSVPVVYDPKDPKTAYRDSFMDVWGAPFMTFIFQIAFFFGSLFEGKNASRRGPPS